jgi:hypothetical protein
MKLVANVGMNIDPGDRRFEPGDTIPDGTLTDLQRRVFLREGYATEVESTRVSPKRRDEIVTAAEEQPAHPVVAELNTKEDT